MLKKLSCLSLMLIMTAVCAAPKQVIIIRHGDKLLQKKPGPTLTAKGQLRAEKFAFYYLDKFPDPDFIFATNPEGHGEKGSSIRELQTVAPLANMLAVKHPGFPIYHPYLRSEYKQLAKEILTGNKYTNKLVLICWEHSVINKLSKELGVKDDLDKWPSDDFDTVYVIDYDANGLVTKFTALQHQYPVEDTTWKS